MISVARTMYAAGYDRVADGAVKGGAVPGFRAPQDEDGADRERRRNNNAAKMT